MDKLKQTFIDLQILSKNNIEFVLTRLNRNLETELDDLDILLKAKDFLRAIKTLEKIGYQSFSHDQALGGRIKGMQKNLIKESRIKIDLHKDFTWKKAKYLDLSLIWNNLEQSKINGIGYLRPIVEIDIFIIVVNIVFEKTYITKDDFDYINDYLPKIFQDLNFDDQAKKYGWYKTYILFKRWFRQTRKKKFPIFLPVYLILFSYLEKLICDKRIALVSLLYYVFFRTRFEINGVLPYE